MMMGHNGPQNGADRWVKPASICSTFSSRAFLASRKARQPVTLRATLTLTLAFLAAPLAGKAQPAGKAWRVGFLLLGFQSSGWVWWEVFLEAMHELNYVQGRNLVRFTFASNQPERLAGLAGDLVHAGAPRPSSTRSLRARRQARRHACRAAYEVRVGDQSETRQGAWADHPAIAAATGR
jgi:hypothetical protein